MADNGIKELEDFLAREVPLGGKLSPEQSARYKKLLVANGVVSVGADGLLDDLDEVGRDQPIPECCKIDNLSPKP